MVSDTCPIMLSTTSVSCVTAFERCDGADVAVVLTSKRERDSPVLHHLMRTLQRNPIN